MAHWAELDENNKVIRVLVGDNASPDEGESFMNSLGGRWVKTSYNAATNGFRKNFAGIGYEYRADIDAFVPPQPFESWMLDEDAQWQPPVEYPSDGKMYAWNESTLSWEEIANG